MTKRTSLQGYLLRDLESRKKELEWALCLGIPLCLSHVQHMTSKSPCPRRKIICCKDCLTRCSLKDRCVGHTVPSMCCTTLREILNDFGLKDKTLKNIKNMLFGEEEK